MRASITGITGFIGTRLALGLRDLGHEVGGLGLENTPAERSNRELLSGRGIEVVLGSVTEPGDVERSLEGAGVVVHLAAAQHEMSVPDEHFHRVNVEGTRNVLEGCLHRGVGRVVHGSTIGVYGELAGVIDEDSPCRPDNIYGRTKLEGERLALSYADRLEVLVLRIPETYGPGDRRLLKLFRSLDRGVFRMIGSGRNFHHPMYVDDLVEALRMAAEAEGPDDEVILLAGAEAVTTRRMVEGIAAALGRRPPRLSLPLFPFAVAAAVLEDTLRPLGIQPPLHRRRLDFFRKSFQQSGARAERLLGFSPRVGFAEGARRTAEWYRSEDLL